MNKKSYILLALIAPTWTVLAQLAVNRYEGWGQWAAAPLLLLPLLYGTLIGMIGLVLIYSAYHRRQPVGWRLGWSLVAFYPFWLVLLRLL